MAGPPPPVTANMEDPRRAMMNLLGNDFWLEVELTDKNKKETFRVQ
jgi:hypothetical protein